MFGIQAVPKEFRGNTNMADFILSCCSTADMSKDYFTSRDIHYVCFHYYLDGTEYKKQIDAGTKYGTYKKYTEFIGNINFSGNVEFDSKERGVKNDLRLILPNSFLFYTFLL